jgi:hypothetical protein
MSRPKKNVHRWTATAVLAGAIAIGATGCVAVPVGGDYGGYGYAGPAVGYPAPGVGVTIAPPPIVFGGGRSHGHYRYGHFYRGRGWRG